MKISIKEKTNNLSENNWFEKVLSTLNNLDCTEYVKGLIYLPQKEQGNEVKKLQKFIKDLLEANHKDFDWQIEYKVDNNRKDSIDIIGIKNNEILIIELDKWRADQVAKKIMSRTALMIDKKIALISLCYAGTDSMDKNECIKYFKYGNIIQTKLGNYYAGMIIE